LIDIVGFSLWSRWLAWRRTGKQRLNAEPNPLTKWLRCLETGCRQNKGVEVKQANWTESSDQVGLRPPISLSLPHRSKWLTEHPRQMIALQLLKEKATPEDKAGARPLPALRRRQRTPRFGRRDNAT
jgi:hypothetical protein